MVDGIRDPVDRMNFSHHRIPFHHHHKKERHIFLSFIVIFSFIKHVHQVPASKSDSAKCDVSSEEDPTDLFLLTSNHIFR